MDASSIFPLVRGYAAPATLASTCKTKARGVKYHLTLLALLLFANCRAAIILPIELENGSPITVAHINGIKVRLIVDSGGGVLSLKPDTIARVGAVHNGLTKTRTDAFGNSGPQPLFTLQAMVLGDKTFLNIEAGEIGTYGAESSPGDGAIGRNFLNQFVTIYDYAAKRITLLTPDEERAIRSQCLGSRILTIPDSVRIIVSMVTTDHGTMRMLWDTGASYSFAKKSYADAQKPPIEGLSYISERLRIGASEFGPLELVVLDLKAPANVDGYIGYNFFINHVVCIDPMNHVIRIRKN